MTAIEWTDRTWNPVTGCTKVSPGCVNCYAERLAVRLRGRAGYPADEPFRPTLHPDRLDQPLTWRAPQRVFVCSMADLFHRDVPDEFIAEVFAVMHDAHWLTFQVLTKRPRRMAVLLDDPTFYGLVLAHVHARHLAAGGASPVTVLDAWPLPNVWVGTSVENQYCAAQRIGHLAATRAAVRFLSIEPLLEPVELRCPGSQRGHGLTASYVHANSCCARWLCGWLGWVIVGGESGPGARPMHPDWARHIRDTCVDAGVAFFFKQWGQWMPLVDYLAAGGACPVPVVELPTADGSRRGEMARVAKKTAGRLLDGRTWDEMPEAVTR